MHALCRSSVVKSSIGGTSSITGVSPFVSTPPFSNAPSSALLTSDSSNLPQRSIDKDCKLGRGGFGGGGGGGGVQGVRPPPFLL